MMPGVSALSTLVRRGSKNRRASVVEGCTPEAPIAPRSLTLLSQLHFGK